MAKQSGHEHVPATAIQEVTPEQGYCRLAVVLAVIQFVFGLMGAYGVYLYLTDDPANPSRYQALHFPFFAFLFAMPFLPVTAILAYLGRSALTRVTITFICLAIALPLVILLGGLMLAAVLK